MHIQLMLTSIHKNWEWQKRRSSNISVLDLWKSHLHMRVHHSLWLYPSVIIEGRIYCLTNTDFGFNVAPSIMDAVLLKDETIQQATVYIEDIYIKRICLQPAWSNIWSTLGWWAKNWNDCRMTHKCLACKFGRMGSTICSNGNKVASMPHVLTDSVFSQCRKLVGHFSVDR